MAHSFRELPSYPISEHSPSGMLRTPPERRYGDRVHQLDPSVGGALSPFGQRAPLLPGHTQSLHPQQQPRKQLPGESERTPMRAPGLGPASAAAAAAPSPTSPSVADMEREVELLWVALEEERLVVQMKNDVISSLQRALSSAEERYKMAETSTTAAAATNSAGFRGTGDRIPATQSLPTRTPRKESDASMSPPPSPSLSASAIVDRITEEECNKRIAEAVAAVEKKLQGEYFSALEAILVANEGAERASIEENFVSQMNVLQSAMATERAVVHTSSLVRTQLTEINSLRVSQGDTKRDMARSVLREQSSGYLADFVMAVSGEAWEMQSSLSNAVAGAFANASRAATDVISDSRERVVSGELIATRALATSRVLDQQLASLASSRPTEMLAAFDCAGEELLDSTVSSTKRLAALQRVSLRRLDRFNQWLSEANVITEEFSSAKRGLAETIIDLQIRNVAVEVHEEQSNVFVRIAAAKARVGASTPTAEPDAPPRVDSLVLSPSASPIQPQQQLSVAGQQAAAVWRESEASYLAKIRSLEERHAQKATLVTVQADRMKELDAKVTSLEDLVQTYKAHIGNVDPQSGGSGQPFDGAFGDERRTRSPPRRRRSFVTDALSSYGASMPETPREEEIRTPEHQQQRFEVVPPSALALDNSGNLSPEQRTAHAREVAAASLREQLGVQTQLLRQLEGVERDELFGAQREFFEEFVEASHEVAARQLLVARAEQLDDWQVELGDTVRNERKRLLDEARFRHHHEELLRGFDNDLSGEGEGLGIAGLMQWTGAEGSEELQAEPINSTTVLLAQAMLLQHKRSMLAMMEASRSMLADAFAVFAPRRRAPETIRVQVAEGALALTEAQRDQSMTVSHWLTSECQKACEALQGLLYRTDVNNPKAVPRTYRDPVEIVGEQQQQAGTEGMLVPPQPQHSRPRSGTNLSFGSTAGDILFDNNESFFPRENSALASNKSFDELQTYRLLAREFGVAQQGEGGLPGPGTAGSPPQSSQSGGVPGFPAVAAPAAAQQRVAQDSPTKPISQDPQTGVIHAAVPTVNPMIMQADSERVNHLCDRFLEGISELHNQLVATEVELGETRMNLQEAQQQTGESKRVMDHATIAQLVEREISDDVLLTLRENLRAERCAAIDSIVALTEGAEERNRCIVDLQQTVSNTSTNAHAATLMANYCFDAFSAQLAQTYDVFALMFTREKLTMLPSISETSFLFLLVHAKLGSALEEAFEVSLEAFQGFNTQYLALIRERERYTSEAIRITDELIKMQNERRLERASTAFVEMHIREQLFEGFLAAETMNFEAFQAMARELRASLSDQAEAREFLREARALRGEMENRLVAAQQTAEEQQMAASVATQKALGLQELLNARDEDLARAHHEVNNMQIRDRELTSSVDNLMDKADTQEQLLIAERQAHQLTKSREHSHLAERDAMNAIVAAVKLELRGAQDAIENEKEAHRATIRSFAHHGLATSPQ